MAVPLDGGQHRESSEIQTGTARSKGHPRAGAESHIKGGKKGTSLLVQWLRLCSQHRGAKVPSLNREPDSTCCNLKFKDHS